MPQKTTKKGKPTKKGASQNTDKVPVKSQESYGVRECMTWNRGVRGPSAQPQQFQDESEREHKFLIKKGSNLDYGARPLRRAIENYIEDPLSEELLKGEFQGKDLIRVEAVRSDEGKLRRLEFKGEVVERDEEPAAAVASGGDDSDSGKETTTD